MQNENIKNLQYADAKFIKWLYENAPDDYDVETEILQVIKDHVGDDKELLNQFKNDPAHYINFYLKRDINLLLIDYYMNLLNVAGYYDINKKFNDVLFICDTITADSFINDYYYKPNDLIYDIFMNYIESYLFMIFDFDILNSASKGYFIIKIWCTPGRDDILFVNKKLHIWCGDDNLISYHNLIKESKGENNND